MKKQSIFNGIIFLLLASIGQESFGMKWTREQWANCFRIGMKYLNYAGVLGYYPYTMQNINKNRDAMLARAQNLNVQSECYILNTIYRAYPDLQNKTIKIVRLPGQSWGTIKQSNTDYLFVPCDDQELEKAIHYNKTNTQRYHDAMFQKVAAALKTSMPDYVISSENLGIAMTAFTLHRWHGALLHEGSHIQHNDNEHGRLINLTAPLLVTYGTESLKKALCLHTFLPNKTVTTNVLKGIGYIPSLPAKLFLSYLCAHAHNSWKEYRADQDLIKHAKNADLLAAISAEYSLWSYKPTLAGKIAKFRDPHPANETRAKYFAKAAQKLENEQELTMQALAYYASGDEVRPSKKT